MTQHIWSPSWEKVPGCESTGETSKSAVLGFSVIIPGYKLISSINLSANWRPSLKVILFVLSCKAWNSGKPGAWLTRGPAEAQQFQDMSAIFLDSEQSQSGPWPGRLEVRSESCSALSLKPKADHLFNFLKNWCFWTVVLEKTLESPLDSKEIKPVNPKGNQP